MEPCESISHNLKRLRSARGMTQKDVSQAAGISRAAFIGIENGATREPRVSNLQNIADVLGVHIVDLLAEPPELTTVRFRSNSIKTNKDKARKQQYLIDAALWLKDFGFLQELAGDRKEYKLGATLDKVRKLRTNRPIKGAQLGREALGLKDDEPIGDVVGLLESAGIKIKTGSYELKNFFGFSVSQTDGGPAIIVNTSKGITIERQIFTVAHELGHLLLHPHAYDPARSRENLTEESEADCFAGHFLMPQRAFKKKWDNSYGLGFVERVLHVKRFFSVSYLAVLHRLGDMGVGDYRSMIPKFIAIYKKRYGQTFKNHKEPFGLEEPDFVADYLLSLVRRALDKSQITISRAAEILNVSLLEMRKIINSWAEIAA